jgi:hypothetical protein
VPCCAWSRLRKFQETGDSGATASGRIEHAVTGARCTDVQRHAAFMSRALDRARPSTWLGTTLSLSKGRGRAGITGEARGRISRRDRARGGAAQRLSRCATRLGCGRVQELPSPDPSAILGPSANLCGRSGLCGLLSPPPPRSRGEMYRTIRPEARQSHRRGVLRSTREIQHPGCGGLDDPGEHGIPVAAPHGERMIAARDRVQRHGRRHRLERR